MNKFIAILVALFCFATSYLSSSIMGTGLWFWVIIVTGFTVAVSQFIPILKVLGTVMAALLGTVSSCAVLLGLIAATIGGSFSLNDNETLLLFLFFMIAVCGFTLVAINNKSKPSVADKNT